MPEWSTSVIITELERLNLHSFAVNEVSTVDGQEVLIDGWGRPFRYKNWLGVEDKTGAHDPRGYDLWSAGRDGVFGTDDDVCSWKIHPPRPWPPASDGGRNESR